MPKDPVPSLDEVKALLRNLEEQHRRRELDEAKYRALRAELLALLGGGPAPEKGPEVAQPRPRLGGMRSAGSRRFAVGIGIASLVLVVLALLGQRQPVPAPPAATAGESAPAADLSGSTAAPASPGAPPSAAAAPLSLGEIPRIDLSRLAPEKQAAVVARLNSAMCPCGCGMTLAVCLRDDPNCIHHEAPVREIVEGAGGRFLPRSAGGLEAPAQSQAGGARDAGAVERLLAGLSEEQKEIAKARLATEKCPCDCGMTLAQCLVEDPSCIHNQEAAQRIVQAVRLGR